MVKRNLKGNAKERKYSADLGGGDDPEKSPSKKIRYNLRSKKDDGTVWIDDDTIDQDEKPKTLVIPSPTEDEEDDSDYVEEDDDDESYFIEEDEEDAFIQYIREKYVKPRGVQSPRKQPPPKKEKEEPIPIKLSRVEESYYKNQTPSMKKELLTLMKRISSLVLDEGETPYKFKVLRLPISDYVKSNVIKKISALADMADNGESYKLKTWVDAFMKIPFGKNIPLPVELLDGQERCTQFMVNARKQMDKAIYGMIPAKTQIMQVIAQLIVNPASVGNVIALTGPPGVGKTSFAKNAIAQVLGRPFEFFSLGGASDISNFVGHSYTYEGSTWGRIADCLMHSKVMNPVIYFDELDKVSGTPHGEEIISMLIHLTDRSQNTQFHDRYFSGIDFDLSQCLFIFSLNDIEKVHPILKDRMTIIHCDGYNEKDKNVILKEYIWNSLLDTLKFDRNQLLLKDDAIKYLISEYSSKEKGVRTLIRTVESMMTRLNMLRVANHESMKEYKFYMDVVFPLNITESIIKTLPHDTDKRESESWKLMYN